MKFETHVEDWDHLAKDPIWAILTDKPNLSVEEFFETGEKEISALMARAKELRLPERQERSLDFGCGMGRLTRALARYFQESWGIDVSARMLALARQYSPDCHFVEGTSADLRHFPDSHFDLLYSVLVLQHQPNAALIESYLREFSRVLRPGALLVFQLPYRIPFRYWLAPRRRGYKLLKGLGFSPDRLQRWGLFPMKMTALSAARVENVLAQNSVKVLLREPHPGSGPIPSFVYYCTKLTGKH